jgi:hypothetical protein
VKASNAIESKKIKKNPSIPSMGVEVIEAADRAAVHALLLMAGTTMLTPNESMDA